MKKPDLPPIKINILSLFRLYRLIKKLIKQLNHKVMCFRKKNTQILPVTGEKVALLFGINDYMGNSNDLRGCINDINDVERKLKKEFTGFEIRKFKDSEVTTQRFISEVENVLKSEAKVLYIHYSGHGTTIGKCQALYLYNGPLLDDVICDLQNKTPDTMHVVCKFDSCFSGGMADRDLPGNPRYLKSRYYQMPGVSKTERAIRKIGRGDVEKWVIFSGCGRDQTSADAEFSGRANGAFTFYDNKSYCYSDTYESEMKRLNKYLPSEMFEQAPELEGNVELHSKIIFT